MRAAEKYLTGATVFLCALLVVPATLTARTITVDDDGPADFNNVQAAIDDSADGDSVIVEQGTYSGPGNRDIDFNGKAITVRSIDPDDPNIIAATVIDITGVPGDVFCGFRFQSGEDTRSVLSGFTIANTAMGEDSGARGIDCIQSSPTMTNCTITGMQSAYDGMMYAGGGGMRVKNGSPTLIGCTFSGNDGGFAPSAGGPAAGGLDNDGGNPTLIDCTFRENTCRGAGGVSNSGYATLTGCSFLDNFGGAAGALFNSGTVTLNNCTFHGDHADMEPLAVGNHGTLAATGCIFARCYAISNRSWGGTGGLADISNCTFADVEPAIHCFGGMATLRNCILWTHWTIRPMIEGDCTDSLSVEYSNVMEGWPGQGNINIEPLFVNPENGDYHLKSQAGRWDPNSNAWVQDDVTSPCIDAGDPLSPIGSEPFPNGGIVNMGAYGGTTEASKSWFDKPVCDTIVAGDINGDCVVDHLDFALLARQWLREE